MTDPAIREPMSFRSEFKFLLKGIPTEITLRLYNPIHSSAVVVRQSHRIAIPGLDAQERAACEDDKALPLWIEARRLYHSVNVLAGVEECDRYLEDLRIATDSRLDAERELRLHAEPLQKHLQYSERKERRALGQMMVKQLLMDEGALRIRMHQEGDHATPKVHLSYGSGFHAVSLQVSPAKVLEGDAGRVPKWLIGEALAWVTQHEAMLMRIWAKLQADGDPEPLIVELRGYDA